MIIDYWLITTDANGVPKSADALPTLATSANVVTIQVVGAGVGVYSVRATLMDDTQIASALLSWAVDSIGYVQQVVFGGGLVDANVVSVNAAAAATIAAQSAGSRSIVVTVQDGSAQPVSGARISVLTSGNVALNQTVTTSSLGTATVVLDDGTYKLRVASPSGFTTPADTTITVDSSETPVTISVASTSAPINPPAAGLCTVFAHIKDASGTAVANATVRAKITAANSAVADVLLSTRPVVTTSNSNGYFELDLIRQDQFVDGAGTYQITVYDREAVIKQVSTVIPNQDSVNLEDLD